MSAPPDRHHLWHNQAFWYLAGLEDGQPEGFPHGPTTPEGKQFIQDWIAACTATYDGPPSENPWLPDFYREWTEHRCWGCGRYNAAGCGTGECCR